MRAWVAGAMAMLAAASPVAAEDAALAPFVADYEVRYSWLQVGTSQTEVARAGALWSIESRTTATGLARLKLQSTLRQHSEFELTADGPRPVHYLHHKEKMWHTNFGISIDLWDRVFGTYRKVDWKPEPGKWSLAGYFTIKWI